MRKILILITLVFLAGMVNAENPCNKNDTSGFTCLTISALGNENHGLELCEANNYQCTFYTSNETLPLNITKDYIIKITPFKMNNSRDLANYFNTKQAWMNIILMLLLLFVIVAIASVVVNER